MIDVLTLRPGDRLLLTERLTAEVTENMEDGMWVMVRYLDVPGKPQDIGLVELCHAQDIVKLLPAADPS